MINGPILVTQRMILRPPSAEDFESWARFHGDAESMRHLGGVQGRSQAWRALCTMVGAWHVRGFSMFSLVSRETGAWIGRVGPWQPEGWPGKEIGWGVLPEFAGKGYAREAALATIDYAFELLGWDEVIHTIAPTNSASIALAERLGSKRRGPTQLPEPLQDEIVDCYGQSREEWANMRATT